LAKRRLKNRSAHQRRKASEGCMPLAKTGTCEHCNYEKMFCICNNNKLRNYNTGKRNTSGDLVRPPYQNYQEQDDYSRHQHYQANDMERKFMQEFFPIDKENLTNYISRTNLAAEKCIESSIYKHLYGGKKPWPSHTTSRYCPICILAQQVEQLRQLIISISENHDLSQDKLTITPNAGHLDYPNVTIHTNS